MPSISLIRWFRCLIGLEVQLCWTPALQDQVWAPLSCQMLVICLYCIGYLNSLVWWPRELNVLRLQKTHANRKITSKSRKDFHHFDSRWYKCSQHKQIKKHAANAHNTTKYILFAARLFFGCVVSICSMCVVKLMKVFS